MLRFAVLNKVMSRRLARGLLPRKKVNPGILFTGFIALFSSAISAQTITGTIGVDTLWDDLSEPYVIAADKSIAIDTSATLTISPGVRIEFENNARLIVLGTIVAVGTIDTPIIFGPNSIGVSWGGILFKDSADDIVYNADGSYASGSILEYVIVSGVSSLITVFAVDTLVNGAIDLNDAFPALNFLTIHNNFTTGIYAVISNSNSAPNDILVISNSSIQGNTVSAIARSPGISIYDDGQATIRIATNKLSNNVDTDYLNSGKNITTSTGGGLFISGAKQIEISANTFTSNSATNGGAINITNLQDPLPNTDIKSFISNNLISGNRAINGAGLYLVNSVVKVVNNQFIANASTLQGGGIYTKQSTAEFSQNLFLKNNSISTGGGIYVHNTATGIKVDHNVFFTNHSDEHGGAFDVHGGTINLLYNTFVSNTANRSGDASQLGVGNGTFEYNSIQGKGSSSLIALGDKYSITNNTFSANTGINFLIDVGTSNDNTGAASITDNNLSGNTINSNSVTLIINTDSGAIGTPVDVVATTNWWGETESIEKLVKGNTAGVDVSNHRTTPNTLAPISIPTGVFAAVTASSTGIGINWISNTESDIAGYRIFWSTTPIAETADLRYSDSIDVGPATGYTIPGDALTGGSDYYIAVSAYDLDRVASNDLDATLVNENVVAGNESWFGEEIIVNWSKDNATKAGGNPGGGGDSGGGSSDYWWLVLFGVAIASRQLISARASAHPTRRIHHISQYEQ